MANKMKRLLALVLALTLVAGQMALPALAAEEPPADAQITITPVEGGTQTTTTYTDPDSGASVTITQTQTTVPGDGTQTSGDELEGDAPPPSGTTTTNDTTTESVLNTENSKETNTDWDHNQTFTDSTTQDDSSVTDTNITTKVDGSEQSKEENFLDPNTGDTTINGQFSGSEQTTITDTSVTTKTTQEITDRIILEGDPITTAAEDEETHTTDNPYAEGSVIEGQWKDGKLKPGTGDSGKSDTDTTTQTLTPEHEGDVTLNMKPGGTDKKSYRVELNDLASIPANATVTPEYKDGQVVGWIVTLEEEVSSQKTGTDTQEGSWHSVGQEQHTYINPGNYTVGTTEDDIDLDTVTDGQKVITQVEEIFDEDGHYEGYRIITTTITKSTGDAVDEAPGTRTDFGYEKDEGAALDSGYIMPEEPVASVTEARDGSTITVTYTLIEEDGVPKGYSIRTETRNAQGELIRTENRNIYGTARTAQTTRETDPTAERTTTTTLVTTTDIQEIRTIATTRDMEKTDSRTTHYNTTVLEESDTYELVNTDNGMFFLYQGKMYQVQAISGHGQADVDTLTPNNQYVTASKGSDLRNKNNTSDGLFNGYGNEENDTFPDGYEFRYVGNGAASTLQIQYQGGGYTSAHQFALRDSNGDLHYVYCCDLNTSAVKGTYYEIENLKDAGYYSTAEGSDVVDHIRAIATNGFWATSGGANDTGTLAAVKALLKKYDPYFSANLTEVANSLTEGEALSATQAALWAFGNRGTKPSNSDIVYQYKTNGGNSDYADERNVMALYNLLISDRLKNDTADTSTDLIDKEDITGSSITIHGEATNADGSVKTVGGNTVYNTDVSFQLNVEKSSLTGNLVVKVVQDGKVIRTEQIATEDSNWVGQLLAGTESGSGTIYTIEGLELIEGVKFTLNLEGTQNMEEGVYLYTAQNGSTASQTFVGVAAGERDVDLAVELEFLVSDPKIKHTNTKTTTQYHDTTTGTRRSTRTDRKVNTSTTSSSHSASAATYAIDIVSDVTTTTTKRGVTLENRNWEGYWTRLIQNPHEGEEEDPGKRVYDKDVPLAAAPKTGDLSGIWAAISALSLGAVILLKRKEENA